ncbi:MAG: SDR family oxidoreductase [Myxococcota bacterium]
MDLQLNSRTALVFGGSSGIGRGIAQVLAREGARVAICARDAGRLVATASAIGASASVTCDLSQPGAAVAAVHEATQNLRAPIDILVTNTGGPPKGGFMELDTAAWTTGFQSLWLGAIEAMREVLPSMKARQFGRILLVSSSAAREPIASLTVSNGLRAGLAGLTKSLSSEVAAFGITVNGILPGFIDTPRLAELGHARDTLTAQIPAGRLGRPDEVGVLAAFLASPAAGYITGQSIVIDGGRCRSF